MKRQNLFISYFRLIVFWTVFCILFWYAQEVLNQKFIDDSTSIVNGFYEEKEPLDVVFIGPSSTFCTIRPEILREEYGIKAYNMASSAQMLDISYLYLQETLQYQTPKVVVLDVSRIKIPDSVSREGEEARRWGYTDLRFSWRKIKGIYDFCGSCDDQFFSYVFPILKYKSRWKELSRFDFEYVFQDKYNSSGGYVGTELVTEEPVNFFQHNNYSSEDDIYPIHEDDMRALQAIIKLCADKEIQLVFFKPPVDEKLWGEEYYNAICKIAAKYDIPYYDYGCYIEELGLDNVLDTRNRAHLNDSGATKVTLHIGKELKEKYLK